MFIFGGWNGTRRFAELLRFDLESSMWSKVDVGGEEPAPRTEHSMVVEQSQIVIFGGFDGQSHFNDTSVLDLSSEASPPDGTGPNSLSSDLASLLFAEECADISFLVEEERIPAHKAVLYARCERFRLMFASGMQEATATELRLEGLQAKTAKALFKFIYTNDIQVAPAIAVDLLSCADEYLLPALRSRCEKVIKSTIDVENVACHLRAADMHSAEELKQACMQYIVRNFKAVSCSDSFLELGKDLMREVFVQYSALTLS